MHKTPVDISGDTGDLPLVNGLDEELEILQWRRRQHSVPQVEDVAGSATCTAEYVVGALADQLWRTKQYGGLQVALDSAIVPDPFPTYVKRQPPVEGDDVRAGRRDGLEQAGSACAEVNA